MSCLSASNVCASELPSPWSSSPELRDRTSPAQAVPHDRSIGGSSDVTFLQWPAESDRNRPYLLNTAPRVDPARTASRNCRAPAGIAGLGVAGATQPSHPIQTLAAPGVGRTRS